MRLLKLPSAVTVFHLRNLLCSISLSALSLGSLISLPTLFAMCHSDISPAELQNDSADTPANKSSDAHMSPARAVNTLSSASTESQCVGGGTGGPSVSSVPSWVWGEDD